MRLDQIVSEANQRATAEVTPAPTTPEQAPSAPQAQKAQCAPTINVNQHPAPAAAVPPSTAAQAVPAYIQNPPDRAAASQQFDHMPNLDQGLKADGMAKRWGPIYLPIVLEQFNHIYEFPTKAFTPLIFNHGDSVNYFTKLPPSRPPPSCPGSAGGPTT